MDELLQEIERLKAELAAEREKNAALEEECDLLAMENERLRNGPNKNTGRSRNYPPPPPSESSASSASPSAVSFEPTYSTEVMIDSNQPYPNTVKRKIANASDGKNVISTTFFYDAEMGYNLVFSGGVDSTIRGYDVSTGVQLYSHRVQAPVLVLAACPPYLAAGMMDGSLVVIKFAPLDNNNLDNEQAPLVSVFKPHSKYVIAVAWSPDGLFLACAAHDQSATIFRRNALGEYEVAHKLSYAHTPEALVFVGYELVVALRGLAHLLYCALSSEDTSSVVTREVSLNEQEWDRHVSFTALCLSVSPDGKYLAVATDGDLLLVLKVGSNQRVKVLVGHNSGEYAKPSLLWDTSSHYLFITSEEETVVYVYSLAAGKVAERLAGHGGIVRCLALHPKELLLASASYDKSVILWEHQ